MVGVVRLMWEPETSRVQSRTPGAFAGSGSADVSIARPETEGEEYRERPHRGFTKRVDSRPGPFSANPADLTSDSS